MSRSIKRSSSIVGTEIIMKQVFKHSSWILGLLFVVSGAYYVIRSKKYSISNGLGAFAEWAGGLMFIAVGVILFLVFLFVRNK